MRKSQRTILSLALALSGALSLSLVSCQTGAQNPPQPIEPIPTASQVAWHQMEQYAFVHFTINTFTDKEWGYGDEDPQLFNPTNFDAHQIVNTVKEAGLTGLIFTCKHHDGFCLWPSAYTEHSIKHSPYKDGKGDIVKEVADACHQAGIKFGVYISPWDRNHPEYGREAYITYYRNQIRELMTQYGEIFEIWFDGANGGDGYYGGARTTRTISRDYYDWPTTIALIHEISPNTIIWGTNFPQARWCGNERGIAGTTNWCTLTPDSLDFSSESRAKQIRQEGMEHGTIWAGSEVDVSVRPGWFFHDYETIRTAENMFGLYLTSVGRNATLLLNLPPDRRGQICEADVTELRKWKALLDSTFANDLTLTAQLQATNERRGFPVSNLHKENAYWATEDGVNQAGVTFTWKQPQDLSYVVLQEHIALGQRVRAFTIEAQRDGQWEEVATGTTIGYKRIMEIKAPNTTALRVNITHAKEAALVIEAIKIY